MEVSLFKCKKEKNKERGDNNYCRIIWRMSCTVEVNNPLYYLNIGKEKVSLNCRKIIISWLLHTWPLNYIEEGYDSFFSESIWKWIFIPDNLDTNAVKSKKSEEFYTFSRIFKLDYINKNDSEVDFCKVKKSIISFFIQGSSYIWKC